MSAHLLHRLLTVGLWLLCASAAHAEGGFCPPGTIDHNNGRAPAIVCSPIPGYGQQQAPQLPPQQWERRWGAIATGGALGVAIDKLSKQEASRTAMSDCVAKGGTNCKVEITYYNQCAVVVAAEDGSYNTPSNATLDGAIATGIKTCRDAGHSNCHVYYSACSLPVRIQ
jgi:hypothetical protein